MKKIYLAIVAFLFVFQAVTAYSYPRNFFKVDCMPEFYIFEIRTFWLDKAYENGAGDFIDKTEVYDSKEAKFIRDKYNMVIEDKYSSRKENFYEINELTQNCILGDDEYKIAIGGFGVNVSKGDKKIISKLFLAYYSDYWEIHSLLYNAKTEEIWIRGKLDLSAPIEYFRFSIKNNEVLDNETMDRKRAEYLKEVKARKASGKCGYEKIIGSNNLPSIWD